MIMLFTVCVLTVFPFLTCAPCRRGVWSSGRGWRRRSWSLRLLANSWRARRWGEAVPTTSLWSWFLLASEHTSSHGIMSGDVTLTYIRFLETYFNPQQSLNWNYVNAAHLTWNHRLRNPLLSCLGHVYLHLADLSVSMLSRLFSNKNMFFISSVEGIQWSECLSCSCLLILSRHFTSASSWCVFFHTLYL